MSIGDTVRAALFSKDFPTVKSPQQLQFEQTIEEVIHGEEIDLDELSAAEFLSEDEDENDNTNFLEIAENLGILGTDSGKRKSNGTEKQKVKKSKKSDVVDEKKEGEISDSKFRVNIEDMKEEIDGINKKKMLEEIGNMTDLDRRAIGYFYLSLKEMRRGAKLTLKGLTRMQELVETYPTMDFLYKVLKPVSEVMPQNPINTIPPIFMMAGVDYTAGGSKYNTEPIKKITPKKFVDGKGKLGYKCSAPGCNVQYISWGGVNTHILQDHLGLSYVCDVCKKVLKSMDGLRRHKKSFHGEGN